MAEYRTDKQFEEIFDSFTNGNWTQAAEECVEYGFWANDLLKAYERDAALRDSSPGTETLSDLVLLAELAAELRYKK